MGELRMIYAPIMIPTCNRIKHLKRCIESIKQCEEAADTEIYISVDFPPNEKYQKGYGEVVEYLKSDITGFKKVNYYIQSTNLGEAKNFLFLKSVIAQKYDRYIFCEDDISFSPSALYFFNTGLEKYEANDNIVVIGTSGDSKKEIIKCMDEESRKGSNLNEATVILSTWFSAWGYATWISKYNKLMENITPSFFASLAQNYKRLYQLYNYSYYLYKTVILTYLRMHPTYVYSNGEPKVIDFQLSIYMICNNMFSVRSIEPLSLNWGLDGTGTNSGLDENYHPEQRAIYQGTKYDHVMLNCVVPLTRETHTSAQLCDAMMDFLKLFFVRVCGEKFYFSKCKRDIEIFETSPNR